MSLPFVGFIYSREIHVSKFGNDVEHCADINNPCQSIHYAFYNVSSANDIIKIDGSVRNFTIKQQIRISKPTNITFTSYNGVAWIYGGDASWRDFRKKQFLAVENCESFVELTAITFKDINFHDTALAKLGDYHAKPIYYRPVSLRVTGCHFRFSSFQVDKGAHWLAQTIISINMPFTKVLIDNCALMANHQTGIIRYPGIKGCINLSSTKIIFTGTRIENARYILHSWSPSCTYMLTQRGMILYMIRCIVKSNNKSPSRKSQFAIAIGKLHKHSKWIHIRVKYSRFENISIRTKTAAVMDIRGPSYLKITNCTFKGNVGNRGGALSFDLAAVQIMNSYFEGNEARLSTICGNMDEGGNGGAIYVAGHGRPKKIRIYDTTFVNNTATCFGSAAYIGYYKEITLHKTRFSTYVSCRLSSQTVWYSYSQKLFIEKLNFEVGSQSRTDRTIFHAKYKKMTLKGQTLRFKCPNGSVVNISSNYERQLRERSKVVKCHRCPKHTYTLRPSYVSSIDDTKKLQLGFQTQCQPCSFGASCKHGIKPKPNFWGYVYNNKAFMILCPPGYCCQSKSKCAALHSCNGMRTGRLCGKCKKGYFQSIFTSDCIHEKHCKPVKFWALAVCSCLLLTILFIFLQDIFLIIVKQLSMKKILASIKRKIDCLWDTLSCMTKVNNEAETIRDDIEQDTERMHNEPMNNPYGNVDQTSNSNLDDCKSKSDNNSMAGGLIKIIFFFYQVHSMLTVYRLHTQIEYLTEIKGLVLSIFNLNLQIPFRSEIHCPFHEIDSTTKVLLTASFPICCLVFAGSLYGFTHALPSCFRKKDIVHKYAMKAKPKLLIAILQFILLGYATLTSSILSLVTCLPLADGQKILYVDGNISCYQHWQYGILSLVLLWAIPLIYTLHKLPNYARKGEISIQGFYVALLLPLPFSICVAIRASRKMQVDEGDEVETMVTPLVTNDQKMYADATMSKLVNVLVGPFRYNDSGEQRAKLSWEPVLLLQRILLSVCHTFILEPGNRSLVLLLFVIILTALNFMYRPFNNRFLNATNGVTFILLCITGIINAIYAYIYEYGAVPKGPLVQLLGYFDYVEVIMTLIFPITIALTFSTIGIAQLTGCFIAIIRSAKGKCKRDSHQYET